MAFTKIITTALITIFAVGAFADTTKCANQSSVGIFANTNPKPVAATHSGSTATKNGTR